MTWKITIIIDSNCFYQLVKYFLKFSSITDISIPLKIIEWKYQEMIVGIVMSPIIVSNSNNNDDKYSMIAIN